MSASALRLNACALALALIATHSYAAQTIDQSLMTAATAEQAATVQTLKKLVNIETGTGDAQGMAAMSNLLAAELKALGATVTRHKALDGVVGENIVGRFTGKGSKKIMLMAHMDTVYPRGNLAKAPFRIEGDRAYGPGIGDDKSGIAVILHSLKLLKQRGFDDYASITVSFNTDEEQGSRGSRELIKKLASEADVIFSYEPTLTDPEVISLATSGIGAVDVTIKGKAAHTGASPELGVNALVESSDLVLRTLDLDQGAGKLRFNWTVGQAGNVPNIVPEQATLRADVRYPSNSDFDSMVKTLNERVQKKRLADSEITVKVNPGRPAYQANAEGKRLVEKAVHIYDSLGFKLTIVPITGGGTDAAYAALSGKPVIEGLGLPGYGYHANVGEWVRIDAIPRRLYLSAQMMMDVAQGK
jgi:glutamate carboxypeptidase